MRDLTEFVAEARALGVPAETINKLHELIQRTPISVLYPRCEAKLHGGPGHQSARQCRSRGPHEMHEDDRGNEWRGGLPGEPDEFTDYFDERHDG